MYTGKPASHLPPFFKVVFRQNITVVDPTPVARNIVPRNLHRHEAASRCHEKRVVEAPPHRKSVYTDAAFHECRCEAAFFYYALHSAITESAL